MLPRSFLTMGSSTHTTAEYSNKYKLKKGRDSKLSVLQDVFYEDFKERRKRTWWLKSEDPNDFETEGIKKIIPTYHEEVAKVVEPLYVEESFKIEFPEKKVITTGTFDLIETDKMIRDLKTKQRKPQWDEAIKSFQGKSYRSGFKEKFKKEPKGFMLDCIVRQKKMQVVTTKPVKYSGKDDEEFRSTVGMIVDSIRQGLFYPRREGNYFCSPNSCGFWNLCVRGDWRNPGVFTKVFGGNEAEDDTKGEE